MRKSNKKGFTIVELVIVIAVIAILSAVLIPTFGGITEKAKNSARDQEAKNAFTNYIIFCDANPVNGHILVEDGNDDYYYAIANGQIDLETETKNPETVPTDVVWCGNHVDAVDIDTATEGIQLDKHCDNCNAPATVHEADGCTVCDGE